LAVRNFTDFKRSLSLAVLLSTGILAVFNSADGQTNASPQWLTFTNAEHHFHFQYPAAWKVNGSPPMMGMHQVVLVSLNSMGVADFNIWPAGVGEFGPAQIKQQLPAGAVYLDVSQSGFPGPRFGNGIKEMEANDLSEPLKIAKEDDSQGIIEQALSFNKWGQFWDVTIFMRPPVTAQLRQTVKQILESFRFDGKPAGDPVWAISEARKLLPPEADPEKFTQQGGNNHYYTSARKDENGMIVTFEKNLDGQPKKTWYFRVTTTGSIIPIPVARGNAKSP
jgi:hypothetical protein